MRSLDRKPAHYLGYFTPGGLLVILLSTYIWRFALIGKKTLFELNSVEFGLPLYVLRSRVVHQQASMLWASGVYGGHPLFAEGQASYFSPIPMLLAALVNSTAGEIYALNLFPFLCLILTGIGVIGLCRSLELSRWSGAFAALAVVFSPSCLGYQENAVLTGSFLWVPWCLWAMEIWLKQPSARSATVMGVAVACLLLAGYPLTFHGTVFYMAVRLIFVLCTPDGRSRWQTVAVHYLRTGAIAAIICTGLAAVQLLPMFELVGLSSRNAGIELTFQVGWNFYARGLIYSWYQSGMHFAVPSIGSLFVCILASLVLVANATSRLLAHLLAGILLISLGCGLGSPLFTFLYNHNLLPGLHYFRVVTPYLPIGVIGVAIAAAGTIDGVIRWQPRPWRVFVRSWRCWGIAGIAVMWGIIVAIYWSPDAPVLQFATPVIAIAGAVVLGWCRNLRFIGILVTVLLLVECIALRSRPLRLIETSAMAEPASVSAIKARPDWREYKSVDLSSGLARMLNDFWAPSAVPDFHRMMFGMSGMTPVIWGLHSMDASLALALARRDRAQPEMDRELLGNSDLPPGLRLIDLLAIRYLAIDGPVQPPAFREFMHEPDTSWIMENTAALPRFQVYERVVAVDTPDAALAYIRSWREKVLVIEDPQHLAPPQEAADGGSVQAPASFAIKTESDAAYRLDVTALRPCWIFLADTNYPGWHASIDGVPSQVFSAQVLGKAVKVPAGRHTLSIEFHSSSFIRGAWISAISLLLAAYLIIFGQQRLRLRRRHAFIGPPRLVN